MTILHRYYRIDILSLEIPKKKQLNMSKHIKTFSKLYPYKWVATKNNNQKRFQPSSVETKWPETKQDNEQQQQQINFIPTRIYHQCAHCHSFFDCQLEEKNQKAKGEMLHSSKSSEISHFQGCSCETQIHRNEHNTMMLDPLSFYCSDECWNVDHGRASVLSTRVTKYFNEVDDAEDLTSGYVGFGYGRNDMT